MALPPIFGVVDRFATGAKIGYYLGRKSEIAAATQYGEALPSAS